MDRLRNGLFVADDGDVYAIVNGSMYQARTKRKLAPGYYDSELALVDKAFDPNQPRDDHGRWSTVSDGGLKQYVEMVTGLYGDRPSAQKFLKEHGKVYPTDDESFIGGEPQQCYKNAALAALGDDDLTYVEGYVGIHGVPIAHAWTVNKQGVVRDYTLADKGVLTPGKTRKDIVTGYYGVPIKANYLSKTLLKNKVYGILVGQENSKQLMNLLKDDPKKIVEGL